MKARAKRTVSTILTFGKEYDVVDQIGDNIVVICDGGDRIGFSSETLELIKEKKTGMAVDYDNFRKQMAYTLDRHIRKLNGALHKNVGYAHVGDVFVDGTNIVVVDANDLQNDLHALRSYVWTLLCLFDENHEPVYEDVEKTGGIATFNDEEDES